MNRVLSPGRRTGVLLSAIALLVTSLVLAASIPAVKGLGDKVRLPIFHGGSTWVNLALFTVLGLFALAYLLRGREDLYRWTVGFRWVAAPLWLVNTVLGLVAALQTWDLSGSQDSTFSVVRADPRLMVQFQLVVLIAVLVIVDRMFESRKIKAFFDLAYVSVLWGLMYSVLASPEARALHPDNPVLNSGSEIQAPFFGIVGSLFLAAVLIAWLVRDHLLRNE